MSETLEPNPFKAAFPPQCFCRDGKPLSYLDSAATTFMPQRSVDALSQCYSSALGSPGRGVNRLSLCAAEKLSEARATIHAFCGGGDSDHTIFTRNATDAVNLVASGIAYQVQSGDNIMVGALEHHSNWLPWKRLAAAKGANLFIIPTTPAGALDVSVMMDLLDERTRVVAISMVSNVSGHAPDLSRFFAAAKVHGATIMADATQSIAHAPLQFSSSAADFAAVSAHKMYGPKGIGALIGKHASLEKLQPMRVGGGMVTAVGFGEAPDVFAELPISLEAGTPDIPSAVAWAESCRWMLHCGVERIYQHELALTRQCIQKLKEISEVDFVPAGDRRGGAIISFRVDGLHGIDVEKYLDVRNIIVRSGNLCAQSAIQALSFDSVVRVSLACYTTQQDIDMLLETMRTICFRRTAPRA